MEAESDADLVAAVRRGSRAAAGRLAERYLRACRAVALGVVGEVAGAEDVCQDAFVYAIERIDDCRRPERFGAWLFQITRNRARNHVRDRRSGRMLDIDDVALADALPSPAEHAERAQLRERLLAALAQIPEERREVVLLHDLEGWTHREIAERLGLPPGTVRSHLHHARARLRGILGHLEGESE
ncbi:MAG TPA: sigma-70 family RNA polymerase sigma factor [Longimicrobiaceae bacterium]|nr:sigma-70 family RNA polymerase sigma factor [Longimicrobiaceae bacterium]